MSEADLEKEWQPVKTAWGLGEVLLGLAASFLIGLVFVVMYQLLGDPNRLTTMPGILSSLVGGWIGFYGTPYLVARRLPGGLKEQLGFEFDLPGDIWRGILAGIAGQLLVALVFLPFKFIAPSLVEGVSDPAKQLTQDLSSWRWFVFGLWVAGITPIGEELFFRGLTLRAIWSRWGRQAGIWGSAVIFGIFHFEQIQTIGLIAFGALLAYRATKTRRIGETIFAHATFNLITVIALFFGVS